MLKADGVGAAVALRAVVVEDDVTKEEDLKSAIEMLSVTDIIGTVLNKSMY